MREHLKNPWCQSLSNSVTQSCLASHQFLCNPFTLFDTHLQSLDSLWLIFRCVSISRTGGVSHIVTFSRFHIVRFSLPILLLSSEDNIFDHLMFTLQLNGIWKYGNTRISGPYGPLKILAPAESLLASLTRMFASLTSSSSPLTSSSPWASSTYNVCPPSPQYKNVCPPPS